MDQEIIKLNPHIKNYLWGGNRLKEFNKLAENIIAESWEVSTNRDGKSTVATGNYSGMNLDEYIKNNPSIINNKEDISVLIKYIDANKDLSIQVHPSDDYASKYENSLGKTEIWYVIDANENSFIYYGLNKDVTKEELKQKINDGTVTDLLNKVYTKKGDIFYVKPGTLHAIGSGNLIVEIQENSNITYRVFDYQRKDKDGNLRKLDIDKALDVIDLNKLDLNAKEIHQNCCEYFDSQLCVIDSFLNLNAINEYRIINFIDGEGKIENLDYQKGDTFLIPYNYGNYEIKGNGRFIITIPKK